MTLLSNKDDIFSRDHRRYEVINVPELGEDVEIRVQVLARRRYLVVDLSR